jgi:ubiquinone/menaquinone biosynthesis C-methylase UbiE
MPAYFATPAADLLALLRLGRGSSLLDVGSGTGAVPSAALTVGTVPAIGVDPSLAMLLVARRVVPGVRAVAASLPALPFEGHAFDAVTASFVLSHIHDTASAVGEMVRLLKPAGRLGLTSWARSPSATPPGEVWQAVADAFADPKAVQTAVEDFLPGDRRLAALEELRGELRRAGLGKIIAEQRTYRVQMSTQSYLRSRQLSASSRFMQATLERVRWNEFLRLVAKKLHESCGERLEFEVSVNLAVGTRAA